MTQACKIILETTALLKMHLHRYIILLAFIGVRLLNHEGQIISVQAASVPAAILFQNRSCDSVVFDLMLNV